MVGKSTDESARGRANRTHFPRIFVHFRRNAEVRERILDVVSATHETTLVFKRDVAVHRLSFKVEAPLLEEDLDTVSKEVKARGGFFRRQTTVRA